MTSPCFERGNPSIQTGPAPDDHVDNDHGAANSSLCSAEPSSRLVADATPCNETQNESAGEGQQLVKKDTLAQNTSGSTHVSTDNKGGFSASMHRLKEAQRPIERVLGLSFTSEAKHDVGTSKGDKVEACASSDFQEEVSIGKRENQVSIHSNKSKKILDGNDSVREEEKDEERSAPMTPGAVQVQGIGSAAQRNSIYTRSSIVSELPELEEGVITTVRAMAVSTEDMEQDVRQRILEEAVEAVEVKVSNDDNSGKRRQRRKIIVWTLLVMVVSVVLGGSLANTRDNRRGNSSGNAVPPVNQTVQLAETLRADITNVSLDGGAALQIVGSPQQRAFENISTALFGNISSASVPVDDRIVLRFREVYVIVTLYYSTQGDTWNNRSGWFSSDFICAWYGIKCNDFGLVESIRLANNGLVGTIPEELSILAGRLVELDLSLNSISGNFSTASRWIDKVNRLTSLMLHDNRLSGSLPTNLQELTMLNKLSLAGNELQGTLSSQLGKLTQLLTLDLSRNHLSGTIPVELGSLVSLQEFHVDQNRLNGTYPNEIVGQWKQLLNATFQNNSLTGFVSNKTCSLQNESLVLLEVDCGEVVCDCCTCSG